MKKLLFIALLSLVTLGAKAFTVVVYNYTNCILLMNLPDNSNTTYSIPIYVPTVPPTQPTGIFFTPSIDPIFSFSTGSCCGSNVTNGSNRIAYNAFSTPRSSGGIVNIPNCLNPGTFWTANISYDNSTDTFTVVIS